ncbi:MAG: alpha/beta fold hydrolase [Ruminococcaceae bacterium]|nr:alpha/beta fold hydrolase [Oscillospiraceae bacterium]
MKRIIAILCIIVSIFCLAACSANENTTGNTQPKPQTQHKYEIVELSGNEKGMTFYRDDLMIYGEMSMPEGDGPFPAVIISPGMQATFYGNKLYARELAKNGIAALSFEFTGTNNISTGSFSQSSVLTHAADLNVVIDVVASLPEIDSDNLFLWGHSFGGLTSAYVATQRPEDIKGLILLEPSLQIPDQYRELYPEGSEIPETPDSASDLSKKFIEDAISIDIFELMPSFDKEVLIFRGTAFPKREEDEHAQFMAVLEAGAEAFPNAQLVTIDGADHFFTPPYSNEVTSRALELLEENID